MVSNFYKNHSKKPRVTLAALNFTLPIANQLPAKRKQGQPAKKRAMKYAIYGDKEESESI